jgi:hypothetical protein
MAGIPSTKVRRPIMRRNLKTVAAMGLIQKPRELRAVCRGRLFLDNIRGLQLTGFHRVFKAVLEIDGSIRIGEHTWENGFPSSALAAVRNLIEGRALMDPVKPTGGWPYWHYRDEVTGKWENLNHLWERATRSVADDPSRA